MKEQNMKMVLIYINESHKTLLEDFFEEIHFYLYTVQRKVESVWSEKLKHKNNQIWPGTDCIFLLTLPEDRVDNMLKMLKTFRMSLPYEIVMGVGVVPMERVIPDMSRDHSIEIDEVLLERLKNKRNR